MASEAESSSRWKRLCFLGEGIKVLLVPILRGRHLLTRNSHPVFDRQELVVPLEDSVGLLEHLASDLFRRDLAPRIILRQTSDSESSKAGGEARIAASAF